MFNNKSETAKSFDKDTPRAEKCTPFWPTPLPDPPRKDHMKKAEVTCSDGSFILIYFFI